VKRHWRTNAMAWFFHRSTEASGASKFRGNPFSSTSKDTMAQACRPTAATILASSIGDGPTSSAKPEPSGYLALKKTGREAPVGGSKETRVKCQRDCLSGSRNSTPIFRGKDGLSPGLKRHCFAASRAFSSRPRPRGSAIFRLCGVPSSATVTLTYTVPSSPAKRASSE